MDEWLRRAECELDGSRQTCCLYRLSRNLVFFHVKLGQRVIRGLKRTFGAATQKLE